MKHMLSIKKLAVLSYTLLLIPLTPYADTMDDGHDKHDCKRREHGEHQGRPEMGIPQHLRELGLSETQKDSIFKMTYAQMPTMREQMKQRRLAMEELRAMSNSANFDDGKAQKLADKLALIEKDFILYRARNEAKIYSLLTPEQRQKLDQRKQERNDSERDEFVKFKPHHHSELPIFRQS